MFFVIQRVCKEFVNFVNGIIRQSSQVGKFPLERCLATAGSNGCVARAFATV